MVQQSATAGHVPAFLKMHAEGRTRFVNEDGAEVPLTIILGPYGLLPIIVAMADQFGQTMGVSINADLQENEDAIAGFKCRLPVLTGLQLYILIVAFEQLCGLAPDQDFDEPQVVEVHRIVDFLRLPPDQRNVEACPWSPLALLP